jgi:hypothetical protein
MATKTRTNTFANGRSVACKAADGKSICAFPDVCLSPPSPPAGPLPVPYPNTGKASDTSGGSKTVTVGDKEVMLKDSSYFKKSTGDEAATRALGMGVVSHQIQGKVYFASWSMDVMIEGKNAVRMLDLTTHNHASQPGNSPPWPYIDEMEKPAGGVCHGDVDREEHDCGDCKPYGERDPCGKPPPRKPAELKALEAIPEDERTPEQMAQLERQRKAFARTQRWYVEEKAQQTSEERCLQARRCLLVPYKSKGRGKRREPQCCPGQTGHHLVEAASFLVPGTRKKGGVLKNPKWKYDLDRAPCVCAEGFDNTTATHGIMHTYQGARAKTMAPGVEGV